jgi:diguanylate cyclase (GGDEF)-like protein
VSAIQPHGILLTLTEPDLIIHQASENASVRLGVVAAELIGHPLSDLLSPTALEDLRAALKRPADEPMPAFTVELAPPATEAHHRVSLHRIDGVVVCELEPEAPGTGLDPALFVREVSEAMAAMQRAHGVAAVSQSVAAEIKRLTGYDRVMVCRFDPDGHGEIVAEARRPGLQSHLGQFYPAGDIPGPGRGVDLAPPIRMIVNIEADPSPVAPPENPLTGQPLNLGRATLRSASPLRREHLRTIGVTAAMTITLIRQDHVWGVIECHHDSPRYISGGTRAACEFLGELLSFQLGREEEGDVVRERAALRTVRTELLELVRGAASLSTGLRAGTDLLLDLCRADGVSVMLEGDRILSGKVPPSDVEELIVERVTSGERPVAVDRLAHAVPEVADRTDLCGALVLALPHGVGRHIVWYRRAWRHELSWSGKESEPATTGASAGRSLQGAGEAAARSRPWRPAQMEAAAELGRSLGEYMVASMRDQLAHVALHDPLTGLPNRALLMESLHQILRRRARTAAEYAGLLFLDIDNFKLINDSLGHRAGDTALQQAARRIEQTLRHGDIVGRLGGDEFVVVLQGVNEPRELATAAARIQQSFEAPFRFDGSEHRVTVSIGIAWAALDHGRAPTDVLREADTAMYEAKRRGRGRSVEFRAEFDATRRRRAELERHLQGALDRGELLLEYQPLFTARGRVAGLEALLRWHGPRLGLVGPSEFIPIAEELGLIEEIGRWVVDAAFTRLAELRERGATELTMAVNFSARQLADVSLPGRLAELLERLGIPPALAGVEITEGVLVSAGGPAVETLERLRAHGLQVAIDDFGTGFSSLAYLRRLPADVLKIDRGFIAELGHERADADIVGAVIDLARRLDIRTVAEGVETEEQLRILRELACDLVQGYLLARPLPSDGLAHLLGQPAG